ncbi:hypothetical protein CY35_01G012600 [Sphagnum magellanicum]|nr:hypothetical protein CY35_01G012600 [Sphagnum magellanicum]KAH9573666.1 hypothetical protein CY35_01G012600 [Sphagnum magellanicum]
MPRLRNKGALPPWASRRLQALSMAPSSPVLQSIHGIPTTIECRGFIQAAEARGLEHQGSLGPARGEAFRDNERLAASNPTRFVHTCKRSLDLAKPKGPTTSTTFPAFSATHWKGVTKEMVGL